MCFEKADFNPVFTEACGTVMWQFASCATDQCDDAPCSPGHDGENGDGNTVNDCVIGGGGTWFCVRAERAGTEPEGRHYTVSIVATDSCGNTSLPQLLKTYYVPHDQSPHAKDCVRTTKEGCKHDSNIPNCPD